MVIVLATVGVCEQVWLQEILTPESGGGPVPRAESDSKTSHSGTTGGKQRRQVARIQTSSIAIFCDVKYYVLWGEVIESLGHFNSSEMLSQGSS